MSFMCQCSKRNICWCFSVKHCLRSNHVGRCFMCFRYVWVFMHCLIFRIDVCWSSLICYAFWLILFNDCECWLIFDAAYSLRVSSLGAYSHWLWLSIWNCHSFLFIFIISWIFDGCPQSRGLQSGGLQFHVFQLILHYCWLSLLDFHLFWLIFDGGLQSGGRQSGGLQSVRSMWGKRESLATLGPLGSPRARSGPFQNHWKTIGFHFISEHWGHLGILGGVPGSLVVGRLRGPLLRWHRSKGGPPRIFSVFAKGRKASTSVWPLRGGGSTAVDPRCEQVGGANLRPLQMRLGQLRG